MLSRLAPVMLAAGIALGAAGPARAVSPPVPASVYALVAATEAMLTPNAGTHPRCSTGSFAGARIWGVYLHMSECITSTIDSVGTQVAAIAGVFVYLGVMIPGGIVVLSYVGLLAAAVGATEGIIWLFDRFQCHNKGVTIYYSWTSGLGMGC